MTRRRLPAAVTAAVLLAVLVIGALPASSLAGTASAGTAPGGALSRAIVLIGVGGLSWSDVSARSTPALWSLLRDAATGTLSVRSVHANTCPVDGWLTLSAGQQAGDVEGGGDAGVKPPCRSLPERMTTAPLPRWDEYVAAAAASRFDVSLGLLGDQVADHGGCIQAVGPGAALGAARSNGIVDRYTPYDASTLNTALTSCPAALVDVGAVRDPADIDTGDQSRPTTTRAQQVTAVDARIGAVLKATPSGTDVLVAGLADAGMSERLRLAAATGPGFGAGTLESSSTRQPGLVQLTDLTPTVLEHLGIPAPRSLAGSPLRVVAPDLRDAGFERSADERLRALLDDDEASHEVHQLVTPFFAGWAFLQLALYLVAAMLWRRGWGADAQLRRLLGMTRRVAVIAATVPVSTFLANLLPWWRSSAPLVSVVASVAVFATAISMLALLGPWRRRLFGPLVVVCVATMIVLAGDVMTGSRLQISSLMGEQPVVGGRYFGMGNVTFALFATATLLLCTALGSHLIAAGRPRVGAAAVTAVGLAAVIVDLSPSWGSDLGGPPALLPGVILLVLAILQVRLTWCRLLTIAGGVGTLLVLVGLLDWLRPTESRSHLGRFVQTALDGGAWDVVLRKLEQNVALLFGAPLLLLVPVGLVLLAAILARPGSRAAAPLRRSFERVPLLRSGLIAVLVMWALGLALNDSGAAIPAVGGTLALPLVLAVALRTLEDEWAAKPATSRAAPLPR